MAELGIELAISPIERESHKGLHDVFSQLLDSTAVVFHGVWSFLPLCLKSRPFYARRGNLWEDLCPISGTDLEF